MARTPATPGLSLDEQLCFALYSASRAITARYRPMLDELGITYPQYLVLLVLWESGPTTVTQLGHRLQLDSGTLSPLLKRLEANGLVSRHRRPDDERSVEIRLTTKGRRMRDRAVDVPGAICASTGLAPAELARLGRTLHELTSSVHEDLQSA